MEAVLQRLEKIATRMEKLTLAASNSALSSSNQASDQYAKMIMQSALPRFTEACHKFSHSQELEQVCTNVKNVFTNLGKVIEQFGRFSKPRPGQDEYECFQQIGELFNKDLTPIDKIRTGLARDHPFFNHVSAIGQSISAVGWLTYPEPVTFIQEMLRASEFYTNRILATHKNEEDQTEFVAAWNSVLSTLCEFVKENFPAGPSWNSGANAPCTADALQQALKSGSASATTPPALRDELNKGLTLASQLKSSTKKQQTTPPRPTAIGKSPAAKTQDKAANVNLSGLRWTVEEGHGQEEICVKVTEMRQSVYIMNCSRSMIKVSGAKVNSITLDGCIKCDLLIEGAVVSGLECINCRSIRVQAMDALPTVTVDKTEGFHMFLSDASDCNVYTSLSSEVTLSIKDYPRGGEYVEHPIPHQLLTSYKKGRPEVKTVVASNPCADA